MKKTTVIITFLLLTIPVIAYSAGEHSPTPAVTDSSVAAKDTVAETDGKSKYDRLTDEDYKKVADELGIEVATMKAVVEIEAGRTHQGFVSAGKPLINFDLTMFRRFLRQAGISYSKYTGSTAFRPVNTKKYGSYGKAQWARLESGRTISKDVANKATFWGMFQIGGFNWKSCGCASLDEFVERMSESELSQLELFAQFCKNRGLVKFLQKKDWSSFAAHYNGPSYKKRGYHTRLRSAYNKHKK